MKSFKRAEFSHTVKIRFFFLRFSKTLTKRPKEQGLRYALLVYEKREIGDLWVIANKIADREWDRRKRGLTSTAFDNAVLKDFNKCTPQEKSRRKRYTQSKVARIQKRADEFLDSVCEGVFP